MESASLEPIPRTVKPRKPHRGRLPIIAVAPREVFVEDRGELIPRAELPELLREHPPALLVCGNPQALLCELDVALADDPRWQFRLSPVVRDRLLRDGSVEKIEEVVVNFLGFRRRNGHRRSRYFYPLAPGQFCRRKVRELVPGNLAYWQALYEWGAGVRRFCETFELRPSPTAGGIAAQLLRHPRFYPEPRRKVPTATNEKARPSLPGNAYELRAETNRLYAAALYIDQTDAHHTAAEDVPVPQPDRLRARGRFEPVFDGRPWIRPGTAAWDELRRHHGLLLCKIEVPVRVALRRYVPPHLARSGDRHAWLYTNELTELEELGARVLHVSAAWTSPDPDPGLPRYAAWAREQVRRWPQEAPWLKPTLLAAYGILAAKPRPLAFGFRQAEGGEDEDWLVGARMVPVKVRRTKRPLQSPIANVIQRGMIEAETRRRSLALARDLEERGFEVFSVYADAVMVRDPEPRGLQLPMLPRPWRVKDRLSFLTFQSPQAFESHQITRSPGRPRRDRIAATDRPPSTRGGYDGRRCKPSGPNGTTHEGPRQRGPRGEQRVDAAPSGLEPTSKEG